MTSTELHVGVYQGPEIPQSFQVYARNVSKYLPDQAVRLVPFADKRSLPKFADVLWDVRSGGGNAPPDFLLEHAGPPLVVTVHGFAPMTLSGWEYFGTAKGMFMSGRYARQKRARWQEALASVSALIAVSAYVKEEATRYTGMPPDKIHVCHHGVDHEAFMAHPHGVPGNYFLHISNAEPRKNVARILRAFAKLKLKNNVELVLKLPEFAANRYAGLDGVRIITGLLSTEELAELYRNALAFLFPSLYEGFGLPILEAMACGCPVITSNVSACPEVAGGAALTIDPRDEEALTEAMSVTYRDRQLNTERRDIGLRRVKDFSWMTSAKCHADALRTAARTGF
jgi:glycosyltransferase involved in cell wall biosynthesis